MVYVSYQEKKKKNWGHFGNAQIPNGHAIKKSKINSAPKKFRPELGP